MENRAGGSSDTERLTFNNPLWDREIGRTAKDTAVGHVDRQHYIKGCTRGHHRLELPIVDPLK